jgi:membrane protein involved in colicin uptake
MPPAAQSSAHAPVRAAGLVLTLCATVAGAAGAATLSTTTPEPEVDSPTMQSAVAAVADDPEYDELGARAAAVRDQAALAKAQEAAALRAQEAQRRARRVAMWDQLAQCETGGNWHNGGEFGGGLGIYVGTWEMYGGHDFAAKPQWATKSQQIIVAERIALDGYGGWGCAHKLGWVD